MTDQAGETPQPQTDEQWKQELTDEQYRVLRTGGTEPAGTSELLGIDDDGVFRCVGCETELFHSNQKYTSGTGWPSFWDPADEDAVATQRDTGLLGFRTEVLCAECGGHLGHVFDDGPEPTGKRYCINGAALEFAEER
ncbi:MAG: methionine-R-sulfoxide reductase [halophilic archaeon J07HX5]|nr:MAG: methionine-R-sulfoxide reductase [halophilic archaeon J07HX5]